MIPPEADAEFAAGMEDILELLAEPHDPRRPKVSMDEQPVQLLKETRTPIPATKDHPRRVDYEYERAGTASIFMFFEPHVGWRRATARPRRTKADWALEVAALLDGRYAEAERITLICDNLNTHTPGAFYEAFPPERARALLKRLEFRHTPKHGSWLNPAECELSVLTRQCLEHRRLGTIEELRAELTAWHTCRNSRQRGVDWHFTVNDARQRLKSVYPKIKT